MFQGLRWSNITSSREKKGTEKEMFEALGIQGLSGSVAGTALAAGAVLVLLAVAAFGILAAIVIDAVLGFGYIGVKKLQERYAAEHAIVETQAAATVRSR